MMKSMMFALAALAAFQAAAITATKEYVDRKDAEIRTNTYTRAETDARIAELAPLGITTNDVCNIVTNEVGGSFSEWSFADPPSESNYWQTLIWVKWIEDDELPEQSYWEVYYKFILPGETEWSTDSYSVYGAPSNALHLSSPWSSGFDDVYRTYTPAKNALGVARLSDLPTNHVTKAELDAAIDAIPEVDTSNFATKQELNTVSNESAIVTRLYMASNVIDEVTNYNSVVRLPSRRLYQLTESNEYVMVWNEMDQHTNTLGMATNFAAGAATAAINASTNYAAPRAWSRTTSGLGAEAPSNTTWISTPTTVIAGGLEYAKVVHSGGAIWVLSGNGMMVFDPTNAYLRITADDGTEIFSIEKTDAVTVGAYADGITVSRDEGLTTVEIPVNVVSADHPTMYYRRRLDDEAGWISETEFHGDLGNVYWGGVSGAWRCEINMSSNGTATSGFFKFTYEQLGSTVIKNGAAVDVSGGILCTDGIHKVRPVYNNGSVAWEVVQ